MVLFFIGDIVEKNLIVNCFGNSGIYRTFIKGGIFEKRTMPYGISVMVPS